jgi:hypothetical protein
MTWTVIRTTPPRSSRKRFSWRGAGSIQVFRPEMEKCVMGFEEVSNEKTPGETEDMSNDTASFFDDPWSKETGERVEHIMKVTRLPVSNHRGCGG